jgi:diacylglycerol kinase family enzyme
MTVAMVARTVNPKMVTALLARMSSPFAVLGAPGEDAGVREWAAAAFEIEAHAPVPAGVDGEALVFEPPLRFRIRPAALRCRIARHHPGASPSAFAPERGQPCAP